MGPDRDLLDEQIAYYRARAAEYDATSKPEGDPLAAHASRIADGLGRLAPLGRVLELAAGTGQWTGFLADHADELLVTDASPEMLELNRLKVGDRHHVRYEVVDAFDPGTIGPFDAVFFGFFLSHVPPTSFASFWSGLGGPLVPSGRAIFVDESAHDLWDEDWIDRDAGVVRRPLTDGSVHRAVKVLWKPDDLARGLSNLGWDASVTGQGPFYWGMASRGSSR